MVFAACRHLRRRLGRALGFLDGARLRPRGHARTHSIQFPMRQTYIINPTVLAHVLCQSVVVLDGA